VSAGVDALREPRVDLGRIDRIVLRVAASGDRIAALAGRVGCLSWSRRRPC